MLRPRLKPTPARAAVRALLLTLLTCGTLVAPSWSARAVRVYEVDVTGQTVAAVQAAMRQVLVRATGRRDAADDPALSGLVADAMKYVNTYAAGAHGEPQVIFDATAVERAITDAGRSVWPRERPFTLVVLDPSRPRAAQDAARTELERAAAERGLPISLVPLSLTDEAGKPLGAEALLENARRYGADQLLIGRGADAGPDGVLEWTLYAVTPAPGWSGPLAAGIDHTVDLLAPPLESAPAQADGAARVRIEGIDTLAAYAAVERLLQSLPGVRRANVAAVGPGSATFELVVRGGAAGLEQVLAGATHLTRAPGNGLPPVYRYQPQS